MERRESVPASFSGYIVMGRSIGSDVFVQQSGESPRCRRSGWSDPRGHGADCHRILISAAIAPTSRSDSKIASISDWSDARAHGDDGRDGLLYGNEGAKDVVRTSADVKSIICNALRDNSLFYRINKQASDWKNIPDGEGIAGQITTYWRKASGCRPRGTPHWGDVAQHAVFRYVVPAASCIRRDSTRM